MVNEVYKLQNILQIHIYFLQYGSCTLAINFPHISANFKIPAFVWFQRPGNRFLFNELVQPLPDDNDTLNKMVSGSPVYSQPV